MANPFLRKSQRQAPNDFIEFLEEEDIKLEEEEEEEE